MTVPDGWSDGERSTHAQGVRNAAALDDLVAANEQSNRVMLSLVESVRQETAARDRKVDALEKSQSQMRWVIRLAGCLLLVLLVLGIFNAINLNATRKSQHQVEQLAQGVASTNGIVLDCVNGTGACGRVNAENQKAVLDEVKKYNLIGFYCIRNNPANADPKAENFLKCMARMYPGGPTLDRG